MSIRAEKFEREELASYMAISTTTNQAILCPTLTVIKIDRYIFSNENECPPLLSMYIERESKLHITVITRTINLVDQQMLQDPIVCRL